jgi:hypothetical protein
MNTNVLNNPKTVLLLSHDELNNLIHSVVDARLKEKEKAEKKQEIEPNTVFNKTEASNFLNMNPQSLIRARIEGRIRGKKIDGREYGYEYQELENYKNRKNNQNK